MPNPLHYPQTVENLHNLSQPSAYMDSLLVENTTCQVLCYVPGGAVMSKTVKDAAFLELLCYWGRKVA